MTVHIVGDELEVFCSCALKHNFCMIYPWYYGYIYLTKHEGPDFVNNRLRPFLTHCGHVTMVLLFLRFISEIPCHKALYLLLVYCRHSAMLYDNYFRMKKFMTI